jgi:hypothetical protein
VHFSAADQNSIHHGIYALAPPERRRKWREQRSVPVEISGIDARGRFFVERTSTLDVTDSGCSFLLNAELEENSSVFVRVIRRGNGLASHDPAIRFRVVWIRQTRPAQMDRCCCEAAACSAMDRRLPSRAARLTRRLAGTISERTTAGRLNS